MSGEGRDLAARVGRAGAWLGSIALLPAREERAAVERLEELGYSTLWIGESHANREIFAHAAMLLGWTRKAVVATGIASIWVRDARAAANGAAALAEAYPGRFVLGLGVSHAPVVGSRGHRYERPVAAMLRYLEDLDAGMYAAAAPPEPAPRVIGALAPRMLRVAGERAAGAHPYLVTPAHTAAARSVLGPQALLAPEQGVVLEADPQRARAVAREHLTVYLRADNYLRTWRSLGFDDGDFADRGSDRLVDALVAWGDEAAIARRVREHLDAGADHVAVQALGSGALAQLAALAPVLTAS